MKKFSFKIFILVFLINSLLIGNLFAESESVLFQKANSLYREGKFAESAEIYKELIIKSPNNSIYLYNLGNAYSNLGKRGEAIAYWEKAAKMMPRDSDLNGNLKKLSPALNYPDMFLLFKPFSGLKNLLSLNEWSILLAIFWTVGIILWSLTVIFKHSDLKKVFSFFAWNAAIIFLIIFCFWGYKMYQHEIRTEIVLIQDGVLTRSGPGEDFPQSIQQPLPVGTKMVQITPTAEQGWVRVRLLDGSAGGWIPQTDLIKI